MKNLALTLGLVFVTCLLFWAFSFPKITIYVEGTVFDLDENLESVEVSLYDENGIYTQYYEPTNENGKFKLCFNIEQGEPLKLKFEKEGYATSVIDFLPSSGVSKFKIEDIHLVKLIAKDNSTTSVEKRLISNSSRNSQLVRIYPTKELTIFEEYYNEEIKYFSLVEKDECINKFNGCWYKVSLAVKDKDREKDINGWHFTVK